MVKVTVHGVIPGGKAIVTIGDYVKVYEVKTDVIYIAIKDELISGRITIYNELGIISEVKSFYIDGNKVIMGDSPNLIQGKYKNYSLQWDANIEWI